jgi:hypothetical protein
VAWCLASGLSAADSEAEGRRRVVATASNASVVSRRHGHGLLLGEPACRNGREQPWLVQAPLTYGMRVVRPSDSDATRCAVSREVE